MQHAWRWKYRGLGNGIRCAVMAIVLLCAACSCDRPIRNQSLKTFYEQLSEKNLTAEKASDIRLSLENISADSLNEAERNFRSFLIIKAADKAYIPHSNDTAYLAVKDYFSKHHEELYPEVLYYGGRVYSDIGDYPTALRHFNEALEKLEESEKNLDLRATINSQTGSLLNEIRMYDQANMFVDEAIRIDRLLKDTLELIYDLQLAGGINMRAGNLKNASKYLNEAQSLKYPISPNIQATTEMRLAYVAALSGKMAQARSRIQVALKNADSLSKNEAMSIASIIYYKSEMRDSALFYSNEILKSNKKSNKHIASNILLTYKSSDEESEDNTLFYIKEFQSTLEKDINKKEREAVNNLNPPYIHPSKQRDGNQTHGYKLLQQSLPIIIVLLAIIAILIFTIFYFNRFKNSIVENSNVASSVNISDTDKESEAPTDKHELCKLLTEDYMKKMKDGIEIQDSILSTSSYKFFRDRADRGKSVKPESPLWTELEKDILKTSPYFISNLRLLTSGKITTIELQTAFLIKYGFKPSELCKIFSISPSAIVSRRVSISEKIFGRKVDLKMVDGIIRLL